MNSHDRLLDVCLLYFFKLLYNKCQTWSLDCVQQSHFKTSTAIVGVTSTIRQMCTALIPTKNALRDGRVTGLGWGGVEFELIQSKNILKGVCKFGVNTSNKQTKANKL